MPDAIWVDAGAELSGLAAVLKAETSIGIDTEFLRERTFFPKLCLLQIEAGGRIWCVDTLKVGPLGPLMEVFTAAVPKLLHAARQDLEALYLDGGKIVTPVFDTQIAAACAGLKPQIGYAELVKTLLDVTLAKGQTRTDWSKRPLSAEQLDYAADDVRYLEAVASRLREQLDRLGRTAWALEDCASLSDSELYEPDVSKSWQRMKGIAQLAPLPRARARAIATWREQLARERNLPRAWVLQDTALFNIAHAAPATAAALETVQPMNERFAQSLLEVLAAVPKEPVDNEPAMDARPTPEQKALIDRLNKVVDARAQDLKLSAEVLAPRGEIKAIALGRRDTQAMSGWRLAEIGEPLLEALKLAA